MRAIMTHGNRKTFRSMTFMQLVSKRSTEVLVEYKIQAWVDRWIGM